MSATIALAETGAAQAKTPWRNLKNNSVSRLGAMAHKIENIKYAVSPTISVSRLPYRSDIGPANNCENANPVRNTPTINCACEKSESRDMARAGNAGSAMSIDKGVTPVNNVSTRITVNDVVLSANGAFFKEPLSSTIHHSYQSLYGMRRLVPLPPQVFALGFPNFSWRLERRPSI
jgi:hypothetical protein